MKKIARPRTALAAGIAKVLKRLHYPLDVMLLSPKGTSFGACVRWYVAYSLSLRDLEEMMAERAIGVDHSTVHRWVIKLVPLFEKTFRKHNARWARAGAWMKPISRSKARGSIFIAQWTRPATPSTFCSEPSGTRLLPGVFLKRHLVRTVHPRR